MHASARVISVPRPGLPPSLCATHELRERGRVRVLVRADWAGAVPVDALLDGCPLTAWGRPVEHRLVGRGPVHVLETDSGPIVAKRLERGGLLGGFLRTLFSDPTRSWHEADVAERLAAAGCRTPAVVVARTTRVGLGLYRLELATARIVRARDLLAAVPGAPDRPDLALRTGRLLRRLHDVGLRHRDLQVKNLLVPHEGGELVVIDLDRCRLDEQRPLDDAERLASLTRFARSLVKRGLLATPGRVSGGHPVGPAEVAAFVGGYGSLPAHGPESLRGALCARLERQVAWHRLGWRASEG